MADGEGRGGDTEAEVECGDWKYWQPADEDDADEEEADDEVEDDDEPLLLGDTDCWRWFIVVVVITECPAQRPAPLTGGEANAVTVVVEGELQLEFGELMGELLAPYKACRPCTAPGAGLRLPGPCGEQAIKFVELDSRII